MITERIHLNKTTKQIYESLLSQCKNELRIKLLVAKEEKKEAWEIEAIEEENAEDRLYDLEDNFDALTRCMNFSEEWQTWGHIDLDNVYLDKLENYNTDWYEYINKNADWYFEKSEIRSDELDWLYLELLLVGCYKKHQKNKQIDEQIIEFMPSLKTLFDYYFDGKYLKFVTLAIFSLSVFLIKIIVVGALLYEGKENFALGALGIILILIYFYNKNKLGKRINALIDASNNEIQAKLASIKKAYSYLSASSSHTTKNIHWDIFEEEVNNARRNGVEIPSAIYTAIKHYKLKV
jgi:hypothetical protein